MFYRILQLKDVENTEYAFMGYSFAQKHNFNLTDYSVVYHSDTFETKHSDLELLEKIWAKFQRIDDRSANILDGIKFTGHSLSVSDIVILEDRIYYCDICGWERIKE